MTNGEQATKLLDWAAENPAERAEEALAKVQALGVDTSNLDDPDALPVADAAEALSMMVSAAAFVKANPAA